MKKTLQLLLALFAFTYASAQTFIDDVAANNNIEYTVTDATPGNLEVEVTGFQTPATDAVASITIPSTVSDGTDTYTVTAIGDSAFNVNGTVKAGKATKADAANNTLTTLVIPSTVTEIKKYAFTGATGLTSISTLENVVTINNNAFSGCTGVTDFGNLDKVETLGAYAFNYCTGLTELVLPNVVTIGNGAIYNANLNNSISTFNISNTVQTIGTLFLGRLNDLVAVQVNKGPADFTSVSSTNFFRNIDIGTEGTVTLYVPDAAAKTAYETTAPWSSFHANNIVVGTIPTIVLGSTFSEGDYDYQVTSMDPREVKVTGTSNAALASVVIPASVTAESNSYSVTAIDVQAFESNTVITSVSLPSSVVTIDTKAFNGASNLETINLENVVTFGASALASCTSLTTTGTLTNGVTFGGYVFYKCSALTSLSTPVAESYGNGFLRESGIVSYSIPSTVTSIGDQLFRKANSLTTVELNWADPATGVFTSTTNTFGDLTESNITIYVPTGTVSAYEAASPWNEITNITDATLSTTDVVGNDLSVQVGANVITVTGGSLANGNISIYDITGRELSSTVLNGATASVSISNLSSGVYIVKVTEGSAKLVKRFAKQ